MCVLEQMSVLLNSLYECVLDCSTKFSSHRHWCTFSNHRMTTGFGPEMCLGKMAAGGEGVRGWGGEDCGALVHVCCRVGSAREQICTLYTGEYSVSSFPGPTQILSCWESVSVYCTLGSLTFLSSLFLFLALVDPLCETGADQAPEENHQSAQFCWVQWWHRLRRYSLINTYLH